MQPARDQAMVFAFNRDLDTVPPSGCGGDSVGALDRNAPRRDMERKKLTRQVIEGYLSALRRPETKCLHVVSHIFHFRECQLAQPPDPSRGWIVPLIARGLAPHLRRLR